MYYIIQTFSIPNASARGRQQSGGSRYGSGRVPLKASVTSTRPRSSKGSDDEIDDFEESEGQDVKFVNIPGPSERGSCSSSTDQRERKSINPKEIVGVVLFC